MKRRDFLKSSLALMALSAKPADLFAQDTPYIAVVNGTKIDAQVRRCVELLGGISRFVKSGEHVVIKPNISFTSGIDVAANTHPEVVAAVVRLCKEAGAAKISVLDNTIMNPAQCLELSGIKAACDAVVPNCVHAVREERFFEEVKIEGAVALKTTRIIKEVLEADVLIAVPKAKSHGGAGVSMTAKGMMGLIQSRGVLHTGNLHRCIADLYSVLKPDLSIIDGTLVMTTNGPSGPGKVIVYNDIIASADGAAADAWATAAYEWYGRKVQPTNVGYLKEIGARGLGRIDLENLNIVTEKI
jgi:uncharacterized protein (DUF362 family)